MTSLNVAKEKTTNTQLREAMQIMEALHAKFATRIMEALHAKFATSGA